VNDKSEILYSGIRCQHGMKR